MSSTRLKTLARWGYGARGVVYLIIGGLALLAAIGAGGETTDSKGALVTVWSQPFGAVLLFAVAAGLFCYAGWRLVQSLLDADDHGTSAKGLVIRAGLLTSAVTHLALAMYAITLAAGQGLFSVGNGSLTTWLMGLKLGPYFVAAVGLAFIGAGLAQAWKGLSGGYKRHLEAEGHTMALLSPVCAFGLVARGLVFCIIGGFFIYAAVEVRPEEAGGLKDALHWIRQLPMGAAVYAVVAAGLVAFGLYSLIEAIWRRIEHKGEDDASVLPNTFPT